MMNKDTETMTILADMGLHDPTLTPEQEEIIRRITHPDEFFQADVDKLYASSDDRQQ